MGTVYLRATTAGTGEQNYNAVLPAANLDQNWDWFNKEGSNHTIYNLTQHSGTSEIRIQFNAATGGVRLFDSGGVRQGYWYSTSTGEGGLLDNDGSWFCRSRTGTSNNYIYCNGNPEHYIYTSYTFTPGSSRSPVFYDSNSTTYYFNPSSTGESVRCSGDIIAYYSDERLKDIECNIPNALEKVMSLNGFYYTPNKKGQKLGYKNKKQVGVSAQEVQKVLPEVIASAPADARYMTVKYERIVPLLIEAIKEFSEKLDNTKTKMGL